jgi:protein-tyrosine phosphatase
MKTKITNYANKVSKSVLSIFLCIVIFYGLNEACGGTCSMMNFLAVKSRVGPIFHGAATFEALQKRQSLSRYLNIGVYGPLYTIKGHDDILIKHYDGEPDTERWIVYGEIMERLRDWVRNDDELYQRLMVFPPLAVGEDYAVRYRLQGQLSLADMPMLGPTRAIVADTAAQLLDRLRKIARTSEQQALLAIIEDNIRHNHGGIFYRSQDRSLLVGDLDISKERYHQYNAARLEWMPSISLHHSALRIGHRPKKTGFAELKSQGVSHVVTLLSSSEGAQELGALAQKAGVKWIGVPIDSGRVPPSTENLVVFRKGLAELSSLLQNDQEAVSIYLHCSAGIHRTGMFTYALLRKLGYSKDQAYIQLGRLRAHTQEGIGEHRIHWVEEAISSHNL